MKKIGTLVIIFALLIIYITPTATAAAAQPASDKEEVIYGILNPDGSVSNLYAVNIFDGGTIDDYGDYSEVRNMSTTEPISQSEDHITLNTTADKFYYQGILISKDLPWNIAIHYFLDGKELPATELGGKSGTLQITISVRQNTNSNRTFYDNYALQIGIALDNKLCSRIEAEKATIAEAGGNKQISYTVLPGSGIEASVSAEVHDFEMEAITVNGIKLAMDIDVDTDQFTSQVTELSDAIKGLDTGAEELLNGLGRLSKGMKSYVEGMKPFKEGIGKLAAGTDQLNQGAAGLKNGLSELVKQNSAILGGAAAITQSTFDAVNAQLGTMGLGLPVLTPENYSQVLSKVPELTKVKTQLDGVVQFSQGLSAYMNAVEQIKGGASQLSDGISKFDASASVVADSANQLYLAGKELNSGIEKVRDGLSEYKEGTLQLRNGTSDLSSEIDTKVDEMLAGISGSKDPVVSFTSDKNTNITSVQFVLKTQAIQKPEVTESETIKPVKLTFWQKLLKLFGLYS